MDIQSIFFPSGNSALLANSTSILLFPRELRKITGGGGVLFAQVQGVSPLKSMILHMSAKPEVPTTVCQQHKINQWIDVGHLVKQTPVRSMGGTPNHGIILTIHEGI